MPQKIGWFFFDPKYNIVLLHRRDHRAPGHKNVWDCFGGGIEADESPKETLIREIEEELDIRVPESEIIHLTSYKKFPFYYIHFPDWLTRAIRLGEGAGFAWFLIKDACKLNDITGEAKEILNKFAEKIKDK